MKNNSKGFTLIELLAVIVIMGILMMVAIPAMSKVIENSRKDTFIETAQTYTNAVNTLWKADSLYCGSEGRLPSTLGAGDYYVLIDSDNNKYNGLIERGGNSSWGNKPVRGYVKVSVSFDENGNRKELYNVALTDEIHGIKEISNKTVNDLKRSNVLLNVKDSLKDFDKTKALTCVTEGKGTDALNLGKQILKFYTVNETSPDFSLIAPSETQESGLFMTQDDDGDTYYFRGAVNNNIVRIPNGSKIQGKEYDYYKIIRINGNGTVRMIYAGKDVIDNRDDTIKSSKYNISYEDAKYVNFSNSIIKDELNIWYNNLPKEYNLKIAQESFCNDTSGEFNNMYHEILYGSRDRLYDSKTPTLKCLKPEDNLKLFVGLITADELSYAGGVYSISNKVYYLNSYNNYWTMSPFYFSSGRSLIWYIDDYEYGLDAERTDHLFGLRPVINLRSDLELVEGGLGTADKPFEVK